MHSQGLLLVFGLRTIVLVMPYQGESESLLESAKDHLFGHETTVAHRSEPLIIEVVRNALAQDLRKRRLRLRDLRIGQVAEREAEAIGPDVCRREWCRRPAQVLHPNTLMGEVSRRPTEDRKVLHRFGMPILESAVGNSPPFHVPAAADSIESVGRGPTFLFQAIDGIGPVLGGNDARKLFHLEIFRQPLELHGTAGVS